MIILTIAFSLFCSVKATAQLSMPDNLFVGAEKQYWVDSITGSGSTYTWKIDGVIRQTGSVNLFLTTWNAVGSYLLEVQETSSDGCLGEVQSGWVNVNAETVLEIICPAMEVLCAVETVPAYTNLNSFLVAGGAISNDCALDPTSFKLSYEESTGIGYPESYRIIREYSISDLCGNTNKCSQTILVPEVLGTLPFADFTSVFSELMTYSFLDLSTNAVSYSWNFGDGQTSTAINPTNSYSATGTYTVTLIVSNSCGTDSKLEEIKIELPDLEFYNGFSPNSDGLNDFWNIPVLSYFQINSVVIINRWGSEVWRCTNYNNTSNVWTGKNMNGSDLPDGTYYYIINYSNVEKRGWVFIKR